MRGKRPRYSRRHRRQNAGGTGKLLLRLTLDLKLQVLLIPGPQAARGSSTSSIGLGVQAYIKGAVAGQREGAQLGCRGHTAHRPQPGIAISLWSVCWSCCIPRESS
jgi:hypothetical protein